MPILWGARDAVGEARHGTKKQIEALLGAMAQLRRQLAVVSEIDARHDWDAEHELSMRDEPEVETLFLDTPLVGDVRCRDPGVEAFTSFVVQNGDEAPVVAGLGLEKLFAPFLVDS